MITAVTPEPFIRTTDQLFFNEVAESDVTSAIADDFSFVDNFMNNSLFSKNDNINGQIIHAINRTKEDY